MTMREILFEVIRPCLAFKDEVHTDFTEFDSAEKRLPITEALLTHDVLTLIEDLTPVAAHGTFYMPCSFDDDGIVFWVPRDSVRVVVQ